MKKDRTNQRRSERNRRRSERNRRRLEINRLRSKKSAEIGDESGISRDRRRISGDWRRIGTEEANRCRLAIRRRSETLTQTGAAWRRIGGVEQKEMVLRTNSRNCTTWLCAQNCAEGTLQTQTFVIVLCLYILCCVSRKI